MTPSEKIAFQVSAFLKQHRLDPIPANFTLIFRHFAGQDPEFSQAVERAIDGGVRMTERAMSVLSARYGDDAGSAVAAMSLESARSAMRHQGRRLAQLTSDAASTTGEFGRGLVVRTRALNSVNTSTQAFIADMIDRSSAAEAALVVTLKEVEALRQELDCARRDASKDALTGLGNRRGIADHLARLKAANGSKLFALCDIDRFKAINDTYGHAVGDRVLTTVSSALAKSCAPHFVGRWGGEEFLIIFSGVSLETAVLLVTTALREIAMRRFRVRETDAPLGPVTLSAGVTDATAGGSSDHDAIGRADSLMYRAKAEGRDRIVTG